MRKNIYTNIHYCGDGFKGHVVKSHSLTFCGFCGHEFRDATKF